MSNTTITFAFIEEKIKGRNSSTTMADVRDEIFNLGAIVGRLCTLFLIKQPSRGESIDCAEKEQQYFSQSPFWEGHTQSSSSSSSLSDNVKVQVAHQLLGEVFFQLFVVACACRIDLCTSILKKVELNGRKYPVELCKGKSGKYTNYSEHTGITITEGQSTMDSPAKTSTNGIEEDTNTVEGITLLIRNFANERQWDRYHTPRNIALALLGEVGELAELFQWCGDEGMIHELFPEETLDKVSQEIADVSIYLIRLCDVSRVSLGGEMMQLLDGLL
jgi:dCTP diphosphatase